MRNRQRQSFGRLALLAAGFLLLSVGVLVGFAEQQANAFHDPTAGTPAVNNAPNVPTNATSLNLTFAPLVKQALPAVVSISWLVKASDAEEGLPPGFNDPIAVFNWVRPVGGQRYSTTSGSELVNTPPVRYRSLYRTGVLVART